MKRLLVLTSMCLLWLPAAYADPDLAEGMTAPWQVEFDEAYHENDRQQREQERLHLNQQQRQGKEQQHDEEQAAERQRNNEREQDEQERQRRHQQDVEAEHQQRQALDAGAAWDAP
ncbi:MAG: hypothetical protein COX57_05905 [Alphaproteobacteria bacterium CG_4_10_14_0_2_um_filter_63_37]|nr:MAG: hypothetical protein AUJ55_07035 [Proteobacteria bacterium CG1_02_64_396]PJA24849.1 MAG: hypothetical protein COX57_05905 [Alphaproteobacteria bacterium CG_4_10_14_0_2_um_filter_63_37]